MKANTLSIFSGSEICLLLLLSMLLVVAINVCNSDGLDKAEMMRINVGHPNDEHSFSSLNENEEALMYKWPYLIYCNNPSEIKILTETSNIADNDDFIYLAIKDKDNLSLNSWSRTFVEIPAQNGTVRRLWTFSIEGLSPDRIYSYQVFFRGDKRSAFKNTDVYQFRTAPSDSMNTTRIEFAAFGDTSAYTQVDREKVNEMMGFLGTKITDNTSFVISTGDLVHHGGTFYNDIWGRNFFDTDAKNWICRVPLLNAIGNHDYGSGNPENYYYKYFPYPMYEERNGTDESSYYYSFDWGPAHFVSIDSFPIVGYCGGSLNVQNDTRQYKWLENDLKESDKKWKIAYMHVPLYSPGCSDINEIQYLQPLFEKYGVGVVLAGHEHYYSRTDVNGIPYLVIGGGGSILDIVREDRTDHRSISCDGSNIGCHEYLIYRVHHIAYFTIDGDNLTCEAIDDQGNTIDKLAIQRSA